MRQNYQKKGKVDGQANQESKKAPGKEPAEKDKEIDVSLLNIRVGLIRKAWKHPSADRCVFELPSHCPPQSASFC